MPKFIQLTEEKPEPRPRLKINIIGKFSATYDGRILPISNRKSQALLGYLLVANVAQVPRQRLLGLLWSRSAENLARGSLRASLHEIVAAFRALSLTQFHVDTLNVAIAASDVEVDLWKIMTRVGDGEVDPLLLSQERIADQLFDGLEDIDPEFAEWLRGMRNSTHDILVGALEKRLPPEDAATIDNDAETVARAIWRQAPDHERSARILIKAHAAAGNIGAALAIYARLWRHLEDTYDIEPHKLTQDLIARLRQEQPPAVAPSDLADATTAAVGLVGLTASRPSIAILPFLALSPNLEPQFTIGIADSVVQALSTLRELLVISRASTMIQMSPTLDLRAVGRELDAQYLLHGSIQRSGKQIRITTELIAVETVEVVRVDRLSGTVADVFDLQDRIAIEVIRSLAPHVRDRELNRAMQKRPDDLDAYQLTLIGYDQMFRPDYTTFVTARTNFERAHVLDPTWAPPLSYSSIWHMQRVARGWSADAPKELELARTLAERALERNSADGLANAVSAYTLSHCRHDHAGALKQLDRAVELIPNLALAFAFRAAVQIRCENYEKALIDAAVHVRLSPKDSLGVLAEMAMSQAHFALGNLGSAVEHAARVAKLLPSNQPSLRILVAALVESGRLKDARTYIPDLINQDPADLSWVAISPWPKPILARIEAAFLRLALN